MKGFLPIAAILLAGPAWAQAPQEVGPVAPSQEGISRVVVFGSDPCPPSTDEEIVVCARKPETERYRIPEELRDEAIEKDPESEAWHRARKASNMWVRPASRAARR